MRDVGRVDNEGEGGAVTFDGKKPEVKEEKLKWRAEDLKQKEIEKHTEKDLNAVKLLS